MVPLAAWGVAAVAVAGVIYVAMTLASQGFWLDDLYTIAASDPRRPIGEMLRQYLLPETNPPLHYLLIRWWRFLTPDGEVWLRIPGLLAYALTIVAAAFYPCRALRPEERTVLAGLMAVGFGLIYLAAELRAYSVLALFALTALLDSVAIADAIAEGETPPLTRLAALVVSGWILAYEHYFGFLYAGSLIIAILALGLWWRRWSWHVFGAGVAIAAGFVPWLAVQLPVIAGNFGGGFWLELDPIGTLRGFVRHTFTAAIPTALLAVGVALALWQTRGRVLRDRRIALTAIAAAINLAVPLLVSLHTPLLNARYFTGLRTLIYFGLALLLAPLLRAPAGKWGHSAALVLAALAALLVSYPFVVTPRASWREASEYVRETTQCAQRDIIGMSTVGGADLQRFEPMFRYYLPDPRFRVTVVPLGASVDAALATLNPTAPGCDVVAIATNIDPAQPGLMARLIAATPFTGPGYEVRQWPTAFVARRVAR
jgi:uncharacterized membrane protein